MLSRASRAFKQDESVESSGSKNEASDRHTHPKTRGSIICVCCSSLFGICHLGLGFITYMQYMWAPMWVFVPGINAMKGTASICKNWSFCCLI